MNVIAATVELNQEELKIFIFALKRQIIDTLNGHIKNIRDVYKQGNPYRRRVFFEQNKKYLEILKEIDIFNYKAYNDIIYELDKLYPEKEEPKCS